MNAPGRSLGSFPTSRPRRLRRGATLRRMMRSTRLSVDSLVYPLFVAPGSDVQTEIPSMPGIYHWSVDRVADEARRAADLGIPALLLFGLPREKDELGSEAWDSSGVVQQAIRAIKQARPELVVIADTCLCEYTSHGHCGVLDTDGSPRTSSPPSEARVLNDPTLELLARVSVSQAEAGADVIAPSDMMDGRVAAIRRALDAAGLEETAILAYAAKYASAFYGPFREAADSAPQVGDRRGYQMDPANGRDALREVALDLEEGADMVMVKPALAYLDVVRQVRDAFPSVPLAAYSVSGEYAMLKAASANGWIEERRAVEEVLTGIARAGADLLITYYAPDLAGWLADERDGR